MGLAEAPCPNGWMDGRESVATRDERRQDGMAAPVKGDERFCDLTARAAAKNHVHVSIVVVWGILT